MVSSTLLPGSASSSSQDTASGDLVLRICGTSRDGQIVRLSSPKCTIGSAARCTLRLRARGVGAVHCLILRGPQGTVIRRWRPDTRLNSQAFTDAKLTPGDRLSVGPIELEVVDLGRLSDVRSTQPFDAPPKSASTSSPSKSGSPGRKVVDKLAARLTVANQQGRRRARGLVGQLRAARQEIERLNNLRNEDETCQQRQGEVEAQLAQRTDDLQAERENWQQQQSEAEAQLDQRAEELRADQETWQQQQREAEAQFAQRAEELDADQAQLAAQREALETQQAEIQTRRDELNAQHEELRSQREALETLKQQLNDRQAAFEAERAACEDRPRQEPSLPTNGETQPQQSPADQGPSPAPAPAATSAGTSEELSDILRRMGRTDLLVDEAEDQPSEADGEPQPPAQPGCPDPFANASPGDAVAEENDEEESIDDYMARLLARVGGNDNPAAREPLIPQEPGSNAPNDLPRDATEPTAQPGDVSDSDTDAPSEGRQASLLRRAAAAERTSDLSAMRELAKVSAETALSSHAQKQLTAAKRTKLLVGVVALVVSTSLLGAWALGGAGNIALYTAVLGFLIAALWSLQYVWIIRRLRGDRTPPTAAKEETALESVEQGR